MLVLDTPQFWVNLIHQPLEAARVPLMELAQLRFAIARSAALKLVLLWRSCGGTIVDLFLPHTHRMSSFTAMFPSQDVSHVPRFVDAGLLFLEHLSPSYSHHWLGSGHPLPVSPIVVLVSRFPRLQALYLVRSPLLVPTTQPSLRELDFLHVSF